MKNLKVNKLLPIILTLVLMLSSLPTKIYAETTELAAGSVAKETIVKPVAGKNNTFDVTLRTYGRTATTSGKDIILLLDRSGSLDETQLAGIKSAANTFVDEVLKDSSSTERIAIVTFSSDPVVNNEFTGYSGKSSLKNTINNMVAQGSTHTQGALHKAIELLGTSTASSTAVILLSDGKPEASYPVLYQFTDSRYAMSYQEADGTINIDTSEGNYQARTMRRAYWDFNGSYGAFGFYGTSSHGTTISATVSPVNAALNEGDALKKLTSNVYTIAYNISDTTGVNILAEIASSGKNYTASTNTISTILSKIAPQVTTNMLQNGTIANLSAPGFTISNVNTIGSTHALSNNTLSWTTTKLSQTTQGVTGLLYSAADIFYSEITFRLTATDEVLKNTPNNQGKYNLLATDPLIMNYKNSTDTASTLDFGNAYVELVRTPAPIITQPKVGDTNIAGTGTPGAVVTVTLPDNSTINATVDQNGNWTAALPVGTTLNVDDIITANAKEDDKLTSTLT